MPCVHRPHLGPRRADTFQILEMTSLEILDVSRNKLRSIPPKIANLTSLKVLAIAKNKIEELPVCLGEINSLQVLKIDGNNLTFPPPEVCTIRNNAPSPANENERDAVIATQVKRFMRQHASKEKASKEKEKRVELDRIKVVDSSGDERWVDMPPPATARLLTSSSWTESNPETPRPLKRVVSGRFPVKPSIGNIDSVPEGRPDSPGPGAAPPIPTRSHYRVASQTNGVSRRPQIAPLILTNGASERYRSQSEGGGGSATHRQKRMGMYTGKATELGAVDELKRTSHFRGFSQGYVVPSNNATNGLSGPATAIGFGDNGTVRSLANRPLSDVREHKRGSRAPDIVVEASKNFLYAMSQLHDCVSHLMRSIKRTARNKEDLRRKEDFYRRYSATYLNVRALSEVLHRFDTLAEEDEEDAQKLSKSVYQYALRCLDCFLAMTLSIGENQAEIVQNADPRMVRSFLFLQQSSLIEMRNACQILGAEFRDTTMAARRRNAPDMAATLRAKPPKARRLQASPPQRNGYHVPPPVLLHSNENSRTNTLTSLSTATPRSGESFSTLATNMSRTNTLTSSIDEADEDAQFGRIYNKLELACTNCQHSIPQILRLLKNTYDTLSRDLDSEHPRLKTLAGLIERSHEVLDMTGPLLDRVQHMQFKDTYTRSQPEFWQHCMGFIKVCPPSNLYYINTNFNRHGRSWRL